MQSVLNPNHCSLTTWESLLLLPVCPPHQGAGWRCAMSAGPADTVWSWNSPPPAPASTTAEAGARGRLWLVPGPGPRPPIGWRGPAASPSAASVTPCDWQRPECYRVPPPPPPPHTTLLHSRHHTLQSGAGILTQKRFFNLNDRQQQIVGHMMVTRTGQQASIDWGQPWNGWKVQPDGPSCLHTQHSFTPTRHNTK